MSWGGGARSNFGGMTGSGGWSCHWNRVAKNFRGWDCKNAFFKVDGETIGSQSVEKSFQMKVCLPLRRTHTRVIHVCKHPFQIINCAVHHVLKSLCGIRQPKWCEQILKQAKWRDNRHFWDVCGCNRNLVVTLDKIDFRKNVATMQTVWKALNVWQRVLVRGCHQTETMIITTRSPGSIFFGHHVQRKGPWWFWAGNNASGFQMFEFRFWNLKFFWI